MLRVLPAQGKLILQQVTEWRNFFVWRDSRVLLCNQKSVFTQIAASFICCKTGLSVGGKTRDIAFQHVRQQWSHFCCPFYRSFWKPLHPSLDSWPWHSGQHLPSGITGLLHFGSQHVIFSQDILPSQRHKTQSSWFVSQVLPRMYQLSPGFFSPHSAN